MSIYLSEQERLDHQLFESVETGNQDKVKEMIRNGAYVNTTRDEIITKNSFPLLIAARDGNNEIVNILINNGANINQATKDNRTALFMSVYSGHLDVVNNLVNHCGPRWINKARNDGATPLYLAAEKGYIHIVNALIDNGADINKARNNRTTPLFVAAEKGNIDIVNTLIDKGADINKAREDGATPLYIAAEKGKIDIVNTLIDNGADVMKGVGPRGSKVTALDRSRFNNNNNMVSILEKRINEINTNTCPKNFPICGDRGYCYTNNRENKISLGNLTWCSNNNTISGGNNRKLKNKCYKNKFNKRKPYKRKTYKRKTYKRKYKKKTYRNK